MDQTKKKIETVNNQLAMQEVKLRIKRNQEVQKLETLHHPRIQVVTSPGKVFIDIDTWCDGDELEADKVSKLTRNFVRSNNNLIAFLKSN
jgi:hypothetical protein